MRLPPPPSNEKGPPQKGGPFSLGAKREDLVQTLRFDKLAATGEFETRREATKPRRGHYACPWRNGISGSYWQFKKTTAVFVPTIIIDIYNIIKHRSDRCGSVAA